MRKIFLLMLLIGTAIADITSKDICIHQSNLMNKNTYVSTITLYVNSECTKDSWNMNHIIQARDVAINLGIPEDDLTYDIINKIGYYQDINLKSVLCGDKILNAYFGLNPEAEVNFNYRFTGFTKLKDIDVIVKIKKSDLNMCKGL